MATLEDFFERKRKDYKAYKKGKKFKKIRKATKSIGGGYDSLASPRGSFDMFQTQPKVAKKKPKKKAAFKKKVVTYY